MRFQSLLYGVALAVAVAPFSSRADAPAARQTPPSSAPAIFPLIFGAGDNASLQAAQIESVTEAVIKESGRFRLADAQARFDPAGVEARKDALTKGDEALTAGIKSYVALDEGLGLEFFDRAIGAYEQSPLWVEENFHRLSKALAMRVLVKWAEDPISTRKELRRVLTMDPKTDFPKEWTPPDLAAQVQQVREQVPYEVKVSLDVSTDPPALIYIDGLYRGVAPMSVKELNPGEHYISLVAVGYDVVQKLVKVDAGSTLTEALKPTARGRALINFTNQIKQKFHTPGAVDNTELERSRFLGAMAGADEVIVGQVIRAEGQLAIHFHRIAVANIPPAIPAGSVLHEVDLQDVPESGKETKQLVRNGVTELLSTDCTPENGKACPFKQPVIPRWHPSLSTAKAIVGIGGATLFVTGVAVGIAARMKDVQYQKLQQTDPTLASTGSSVRAEAAAADTLMAIGIVGGLAWGWMQWGVPYLSRTKISDAPVLEKDHPGDDKKDDKKDEKKDDKKEDDPFAESESPAPTLLSRLPMPYTGPMANGWTLGLQGSF